jgi:hypothetical protein
MRVPPYRCECCGAPAGPSGVRCRPCYLEGLDRLLASRAWRENAATRSGDQPGETMLETITREQEATR